ncbi:hypothetical protein IFO70_32645 [Phormidium tenue FACHB-886]|nr:hypothetical protein [Phormidium tenue FACHB-886]
MPFPKHRWVVNPIATNGALASVSCQISNCKRCTVTAAAEGFQIEMTLGDRQWAGWKDYREFEAVLWTLKLHLAWFEAVAG